MRVAMQRRLVFEHDYPVDADRMFALVSDLDTLDAVSAPWLRFDHLPSGPVTTGQRIDVELSVLCVFPPRPYSMVITECDRAARHLRSVESGLGIRELVFDLTVRPTGKGCVVAESVEIDAGWLTPVVAFYARVIHFWRHRLRMRLLNEKA